MGRPLCGCGCIVALKLFGKLLRFCFDFADFKIQSLDRDTAFGGVSLLQAI
jgi:hypothetical protein